MIIRVLHGADFDAGQLEARLTTGKKRPGSRGVNAPRADRAEVVPGSARASTALVGHATEVHVATPGQDRVGGHTMM
jgi:hypothetical protein